MQDFKQTLKSCYIGFRLFSKDYLNLAIWIWNQLTLNNYVVKWNNPDDIPAWYDLQRNSRGDLSLHEDEDENQQSGETAGKHHPDGEFTVWTQGTDDPATFGGTRNRETSGNTQFLAEDGDRNECDSKMMIVCILNLWKTWRQSSNIYVRLSGSTWVLPVCMCRLYCNPPGPWWGWQSVRRNLQ